MPNIPLVKQGKINWICLAEECPDNCCETKHDERSQKLSVFQICSQMIPLTEEDASRIADKVGSKHIEQHADGGKYIRCADNGRCPFLDEHGGCSIYKDRGSSCRAYPFFVDKYMGLYVDLKCPGIGKGWTSLDEVMEMVGEAKKVYMLHFEKAEKMLKKMKLS